MFVHELLDIPGEAVMDLADELVGAKRVSAEGARHCLRSLFELFQGVTQLDTRSVHNDVHHSNGCACIVDSLSVRG